jgi:F0F1-type ATP synthase membrane subunit c/vacuolar-type H+-ATPase subunit K
MSTEMEHSVTLGALAKALAQAQAKLEDAKKDRTNPHFNSKYATLASVRAAMSDVLPIYGLAVVQGFEPHGDAGVCIVTTLMHESGEWLRSKLYIPVTKKDAQGFGSAISYGRRYSLAAIVGIATDDDDDGNTASKPPVRKAPESGPKAVSAFADPTVASVMEKYAADIEKAADVKAIMSVYTSATGDTRLAADAREFITQKCTARRKVLEGRAA